MNSNQKNDLAAALFGRQGGGSYVQRVSATATADSESGEVTIAFEDGSSIEAVTIGHVDEGDEVVVEVQNGHAVVIGTGGWGDDVALGIEAAADAAQEARQMASATSQHFWADSNGAHVSMESGDAYAERNVLLNSFGMMLRRFGFQLVTMTRSAIAFWDGLSNASSSVLASFGADGMRIGRSNKPNTVVDGRGFHVSGGPEEKFSVRLGEAMQDNGRFPRRRIYRVYRAGYSEGCYLDPDLPEARSVNAPVDEPDVGLFFAMADGETQRHWVSDGRHAGWEMPLASVEELMQLAPDYFSYDDWASSVESRYAHTVNLSVDLTTVDHLFQLSAGSRLSEWVEGCVFTDEELAQIPRDKWAQSAVDHGSPNWFIGSVYDVTEASLELNGEKWDGRAYTADEGLPDEISGTPNPDKNIVVDNGDRTIQAELLTAAQTAAMLS